MSHEDKKQVILEFIASKGKVAQNDVVRHMISNDVPIDLRTSWLTTRKLIKELEESGRIKITRPERQGQSHRLSVISNNRFNKIIQELAIEEREIAKLVIPKGLPKEYPAENVILRNIINALFDAEKLPEQDSQILWARIKKLLLALGAKRLDAITGSKYYQSYKLTK